MRNKLITLAVAGLTALAVFAQAAPSLAAPQAAQYAAQYTDAANKALAWMKTQQQPDGSFAGFGAGSTIDALLAIIAANGDPASYTQDGNSPATYLESNAGTIVATSGGAGKLLLAAHALGQDVHSFGGVDLVGAINASYGISATGQYGPDTIGHAFSILGLSVAGESVPSAAIDRLKSLQSPEGGWSFSGDTSAGAADTDTTAVAIQALVAAGANQPGDNTIKYAVTYLADQQNSDGGWPYQQGSQYGSDSDVNSTSYVVQSMLALQNATIAEAGQRFIASLQNPGGAFAYQKADPTDNAGATYQAIPALLGATLLNPVAAASPVTQPGMPVTGAAPEWAYLAALILVAALLSGAGLFLRRTR